MQWLLLIKGQHVEEKDFFLDWSDLRTIAAILVGQKLAQLSGSNMQAKQAGKNKN